MKVSPSSPHAPLRPILRWAGSKRKSLPVLRKVVPSEFRRYIEPFAGSASLFFDIRPEIAIIGDVNQELIETYSVLSHHTDAVAERLFAIPPTAVAYYKQRRLSPLAMTPVDAAARFLYLNRYCFNGVYRTNRQGHFNVPRGSHTGKLPSLEHLRDCAKALRRATLVAKDFEATLSEVDGNDFAYVDPPYSTSGRERFGEYGYGTFGKSDEKRLLAALDGIDERNGIFVLSYSNDRQLRERCRRRKWDIRTIRVFRHIAGFVEARRTTEEVIISNRTLPSPEHLTCAQMS